MSDELIYLYETVFYVNMLNKNDICAILLTDCQNKEMENSQESNIHLVCIMRVL